LIRLDLQKICLSLCNCSVYSVYDAELRHARN
jgi:hypothetical protein